MNILAISLAYPPLAYPRSIQVARLLKHADASTVMFCADEPAARIDRTIEPDAEENLYDCVRVPVRTGGLDRTIDRFAHRFYRDLWNRRNLAPDAYGKWREDVLDSVDAFLKHGGFQPDVLVTFAQPFTDHLIGNELKGHTGLPWFAHFSDPWTDNPFSRFDEKTHSLNTAMERSVAENADILGFTSDETVDLFYSKYSPELRRKARVLPQCFDPSQFSSLSPSGPITIRYLGNFYGHRTPSPLIAALKDLDAKESAFLENVVFELIGSGDADEVQFLSKKLPQGLVRVRPSVDYSESLRLMSEADGLLVIDAPAELSVFLPSKLIDYIGAGRPVFGITPSGTAAKLINELGGVVADPSHPAELVTKLRGFISDLRSRREGEWQSGWGHTEVRKRFTAERVSQDFVGILKEIAG